MRAIGRYAVIAVIAVALIYAGDTVWLRVRMTNHGDPTGAVQVRVTYAIPHKNGRIEYDRGGTETERCVYSLFPHFGLNPCWYVERHTTKEIRY